MTLPKTIESVQKQTFTDFEYIIVDAASTDGTVEFLKDLKMNLVWSSEPDKGYYDGLNKGIQKASGEYILVLNSDDCLHRESTLKSLVSRIKTENYPDIILSNVQVTNHNHSVSRYVSAKNFKKSWFHYGMMPPHPGFIAKKKLFDRWGYYKTQYRIAADFDLLMRFFLLHDPTWCFLDELTVTMLDGGVSNSGFHSMIQLNKEVHDSLKSMGFKASYFKIYSKYLLKWRQYFPALFH